MKVVKRPEQPILVPASFFDTRELPVTLPVMRWLKPKHDPLAPSKASASRALHAPPRPGSLTAALFGDPTPERSALGREVLPHEYASKKTEGRYRDNQ